MTYPTFRKTTIPSALPEEAVPAWLAPESRTYLTARGLSRDEVEDYQLCYCASGYWKQRVLIPLYDWSPVGTGRLLGIQGRAIADHSKRYLTQGTRPLYVPWETMTLQTPLCVCEGPFDAFAVNRICAAVATLGNQPSEKQLQTLSCLIRQFHATKIVIWYDDQALAEAFSLQLRLNPIIPTVVVEDAGAKDPGELAPKLIESILERVL